MKVEEGAAAVAPKPEADSAPGLCPECGGELHEGTCDECGWKKPKKKMDRVGRVDVALAREDWMTRPFERTAEGFLKGRAVVTSIGVFQYRDSDGTMHGELRLPEEVFAPESLETLKLKPVTNEHPGDMVEPSNVRDLAVGSLGSNPGWTPQLDGRSRDEDYTDGQHVAIDMVITDPQAISDVLNGKRALSSGYTCDIEEASGVYLGMPYQAVQRNIRYNHVAIVDRARAGDAARIRMDGAAVHVEAGKKEGHMKVIKVDGVELQLDDQVAAAVLSLQSKLDTATADRVKLEAERDATKARADKAEEALAKYRVDGVREAVARRRELERVAADAGVEVKADASDADVQRSVIAKVLPRMNLDGKDEVYVAAAFDSAVSAIEARADADKSAVAQPHADGAPREDSAGEARKRMINGLTGRKE